MVTATKQKMSKKNKKLEIEYEKLFTPTFVVIREQNTSLEQPHIRKVVPSVATYAAYEDPI